MDLLGLGPFFVCSEVANIFDNVTIWEHFRNLCAKVGVECTEHLARAQAATQTRDWFVACAEWTSCGDVVVRSGLLDRDDRIWLSCCHALRSANFWAFYLKNSGRALKDAIAASKAWDEVQNVPEALDFKSYVEATLLKVMYLWASTSDCEEEALDADVKAFLIDKLKRPGDSMSDSEVRTLKQQCKEFVINNSVSVIWEVQKDYSNYFEIEECLRWAREGSKLYRRRYSGKLDYVSKFNEAFTLCTLGNFQAASRVFEEIICYLDSEPWKAKGTVAHPAALYCNPQYTYSAHYFLCLCYRQMAVQSGRGQKNTSKWIELVNIEEAECQSLLAQREYAEMFRVERDRVREAFEYAAKNKWQGGYEKWSKDESKWVHFTPSAALSILHANFRTEYRQSYESGTPNERYFLNAKLCSMEVLKNCDSLGPIDYLRIRTFMDLVRLHHEKDREVMFLKQSSNFDVEEKAPILQYGGNATECYVKDLLRRKKSDDYWVVAQESCSYLYYMLQFHYFAKWIASRACTPSTCDIKFTDRLQQLWNQSLMSELTSAESSVSQEMWKQSLVWAERRVGKAIYFQIASNMLSTSAMQQLCEFDLRDDVAWNTLKSNRAACGPGTVVLEYFLSEENDLQFVYVMTKDDEVFMQILKVNGLDSILWKLLKWLSHMCSLQSHECRGALINGVLELLYEILISPVANFLDGMEQEDKLIIVAPEEDKLIIVAPEILSDVPFAALRKPDSPVGEGYLIQSHTISGTPSLRMLQHCNERLKELDQDVLDTKPGTIVAVGDPAYKDSQRHGKAIGDPEMSPMCLKASGEEVNFIEELFGKEHVKKLVGPEATPPEVLKWAKYPSENCVKQVVFHIAAHGIGQDDDGKVKKGAIVLARPASSCQQNCGQGAHTSRHGEVGGIRSGIDVPISKYAPHILKSENISGCGFQWKAHMVVLSACDTARGQITGEGVLNLSRALMIAGVPCVVVSQWKVGDSSTCELMKGFYQELRSGKDVSSSLRAAMLKMIKDEAKVHEWAPFFVCGLPTVCLPTELQGGTSSCNVHDYGTSSDTKAEQRGKDVKVKLLDLTDWQIERFFKPGELRKLRKKEIEDVEELEELLVMVNSISASLANGGKINLD